MKKGFSLVELLIVLAVIASIIAISTPLALNAMRKARAAAVASDFKTLSRAISSSMYLGDGIPSSIDSLGRNVSSDYGVAWSDGEDVYDFVIFTNKEVDTSTLYTLLTNTGAGFPAGEYEFFPGGAANSENSKAYYHVYLDGSGSQTVSAGKSFVFTSLNDLSFFNAFKSYGQGNWQTTGSGLSGSGDIESRNRGILDTDENWSDYEINVDLDFNDNGGTNRGYKIFFRTETSNAKDPAHNVKAYYLEFAHYAESASTRRKLELGYTTTGWNSSSMNRFSWTSSNLQALNYNKTHSLKIRVQGNQFEVYFNGELAFTATNSDDTRNTNGRIGLETYGNVEVVFKNVTVKPL